MAKAPSSSSFNNQLMQEYTSSQTQLNQQESAFSAQQAADNAAAQAAVNAQQSGLLASEQSASANKAVTLSTILTSPNGALGNPPLALQKLS